MALNDLLRAIEAEADEERRRAGREATDAAAVIVAEARTDAAVLEAELAEAPVKETLADADRLRALARLQAAGTVRAAREEAFLSLLSRLRTELAALRESDTYPAVFAALLDESLAALPDAQEVRVDRRDADLATPMVDGLRLTTTLSSWGGVEVASDDGRTIRNTLEERLTNADVLLRARFAEWLTTTAAGAGSREGP